MRTVIFPILASILFYIVGVSVSYISTTLYFYYTLIGRDRNTKEQSLKWAKADTRKYLGSNVIFAFSWFFFIVFLVYVLGVAIKLGNEKILNLVVNHTD